MKAEVLLESGSNQIYLSDFVENPVLLREMGKDAIIFGYAPMPGRSMKVSLDYVISKFNRYLEGVTFICPEQDIVFVYRKASTHLSESATQADMSNDVGVNDEKSDFEIYNERALKEMFLKTFEQKLEVEFDEKINLIYEEFPPTPFKAKIESINIYSRGSKKYMVRIEYFTEEGNKKYETAVFTTTWPVTGFKTNKLIRKDVLLSEEYLSFQGIDYFDYKDPVLSSQLTYDYVADYTISEDHVLEWGMLKKRAYVLKGQIINAVVQLSGMIVTSKVEMIDNAEIGQLVRAKNVDTGIIITGILDEGPILRVSY
ncbi:MAG: flagella basal body P-ring formation protein FlgA [Thermotogota bacterium]|nr:flagella basal body P-ring formation protein FlgA [Thermotogota bacterium]